MNRSIGKESQARGYGYLADRAPGNGSPIATLVRREGEEWGRTVEGGQFVATSTDEPIYDDETAAQQEARRRWGAH